jgi:hypothetical protein
MLQTSKEQAFNQKSKEFWKGKDGFFVLGSLVATTWL